MISQIQKVENTQHAQNEYFLKKYIFERNTIIGKEQDDLFTWWYINPKFDVSLT